MFLKFKAPDRHNDIIVAREDISVISAGEFLYTRSGQRFHIYPIDGQELKRFGLVTISPSNGDGGGSNAMENVTKSGRK